MPVELVPGPQDPPAAPDSSAPAAVKTAPRSRNRGSWVGQVLRPLNSKKTPSDALTASDPLAAFASEHAPQESVPPTAAPPPEQAPTTSTTTTSTWKIRTGAVLPLAIAIVLTAAVTFGLTRVSWPRSTAPLPPTGKLTIVTRPAGAQLTIDGADRGLTPLTLSLGAGEHAVNVRLGPEQRAIAVTITAGADIVRDLEMTAAAPNDAFGQLSIVTDPPGARVTIDGQSVGASPLTVDRLSAGEHHVAVATATGSADRKVTIEARHAASVVFSLPKSSGPLGGWLSVSAPFDVQVVEHDEVIANGSAKIMLAAGRHDIVLANRALGYQETRRLDVTAGQTTTVRIDPPPATINVNARPWADVSIDGTDLGQTPISNATVSIGSHQLVFRHPQLGERRETVLVTLNGPNRIAVDLTK